MTIGLRIKEERERLQMTQSEFGESCGVKRLAQIRFEKDTHVPGGSYLIEAASLGCDVQYLLTGVRSVNVTKPQASVSISFNGSNNMVAGRNLTTTAPKGRPKK